MENSEPGLLRYIVGAVIVVFGATGLAMNYYEKEHPRVIMHEAQMAPPPEMVQPHPADRVPAKQTSKQTIKGLDSLASKVQKSIK
jgi:hypothetical protein